MLEFYHDFKALGLSLPQRGGIYAPNQAAKAPILTGYLLFALGKLKARGISPSVIELFCADAYYSFIASRFGAAQSTAIDSNRDGHLSEAQHVKAVLGDATVQIRQADVFALPSDLHSNVVLNAGGLYHVTDPLRALDISYALATDYLIVQSVVSLADERASYFETPAPGWTWGCRFSHAFLENAIRSRGWIILDSDRNVLTGNDRPEDRGSSYFLIAKPRHTYCPPVAVEPAESPGR